MRFEGTREVTKNTCKKGIAGTLLEWARFAGRRLGQVRIQRRERLLRVCESLSLGERRFLAIVQVERERLLIGGTAQSITLLQKLEQPAAADRSAAAESITVPAEVAL